MMEQAAQPSFFGYWKEILTTLAAFSAVVFFVLAAIVDKLWIWSFDRCKETIMARIDLWYAHRIEANAKAWRQVDHNTEKLTGFESTMSQQGFALKAQLESHFAANTVALQAMTAALQSVQREAQTTAEDVAHIRGLMGSPAEWDGNNRRKRTRRNPGGQP